MSNCFFFGLCLTYSVFCFFVCLLVCEAPYHAPAPLMAGGTTEDMELAKWCKTNGCLDQADQSWLSVLAVPAKILLSHPKVHDGRVFLAGHTFVGSCLQGLPVRAVRVGESTFYALEVMTEFFWLPIVDWRDWTCTTCSWQSPLAVKKATTEWCRETPLLLKRTSKEHDLLQTCAMNAFWEIPKSGLLSIARATGIHVEKDKTLPDVMLCLVEGVLGPQSDSEKLRLLRLRMPRKADLLHLMENASADDILEPDDLKQLRQAQADHTQKDQDFGQKIQEMSARVRAHASASATSSTRGKATSAATNQPKSKRARRAPPQLTIDESTTVQDLDAYLPSGCKFGYDGIDHCWRLSAYGTRYGRSVQLHGRSGGAMQLLSLAWRRAIEEGWETECPFPSLLG